MKQELFGNPITVEFDDDGEGMGHDELAPLYDRLVDELTEDMYIDYVSQIAVELIDSAYQQDGEPDEDEYDALEEELMLMSVTVYPDAYMLVFTAEESFPDSEILVQIEAESLEIEDIIVEEA